MIWLAATLLLLLATPFVVWPLLTHWTREPPPPVDAAGLEDLRRREREELELDS